MNQGIMEWLLEARFADETGHGYSQSRLSSGSWSEAQAVEVVNTAATELAASLSPDIAHEFGGLAKLASYSEAE